MVRDNAHALRVPRSALPAVVTAAALALLGLCPFWLPFLPVNGFWLARSLALVGSVAALATMGRNESGRSMVLASPAVILPLLALVFYSLIPAAYVEWRFGGPLSVPPEARPEDLHEPDGIYVAYAAASMAEAWILAFSGVGLLLAMAFDRLIPDRQPQDSLQLPMAWGLTLICCAGAVFQAGKALLPSRNLLWATSLGDMLPPLVMFGMALLFSRKAAQSVRQGLWTMAGLGAGFVMLFPYQIKAYVLFMASLLLSAVSYSRGRVRMVIIAVLLAFPALGAGMVMFPRGMALNLTDKIIYRQSETVFCLNFALREAASGGGEWRNGPLYFATGLVPRILWPDKPSLSHGSAFGKFCGVNIPRHSASVTLLGEPPLRGGPWGIVGAGLTLAGISAATVAAWKRGGPIVMALALSLTPWLIDFDQHFAMYLANLVKALLVMLPVALLIQHLLRRGDKTTHTLF